MAAIHDPIPPNELRASASSSDPYADIAPSSSGSIAVKSPTFQPFTSRHLAKDAKVTAMYREITGQVVGPMPVEAFIDEFLPGPVMADIPWSNATSPEAFEAVGRASSETNMYPFWIEAVAPFCPGLELVDTHAEPAEPFDGKDITPSVVAYARNSRRTRTSDIVFAEIIPEFNYADTDDPFTDDDPESFERDSRAARDTLGQITLYAAAHLAAQFRTHIFSLLVFREHSRLLRWDRSGVVVTKKFPLQARYTAEFFWRYDHAPRAVRGFDECARSWVPNGNEQRIRSLLRSTDDTPLVELTLCDNSNSYLIRRSAYLHLSSPTGRSTRSFLAYCAESNAIVWLKDTWRIISPAYTAEHLIYEKLHAHSVPYIPCCKEGADVRGHGPGGVHQTKTQDYQARSWARPLPRPLRVLRHYRLILQDVGRACTKFETVKEFVKVMRDISEAHDGAYFDARILHRDISVGNILILGTGEDARGMLIDWDLSKDLSRLGAPTPAEHLGTWQFMAARLHGWPLGDDTPRTAQREDDIESMYYVMVWVAMHFTYHPLPASVLANLIKLKFEQSSLMGAAIMKGELLIAWGVGVGVKFANEGLAAMLKSLATLLAMRYIHEPPSDSSDSETNDDPKGDRRKSILTKRGGFTKEIEAALAAGRWEPRHQRVVHKLTPETDTRPHRGTADGPTGNAGPDGPPPYRRRRLIY